MAKKKQPQKSLSQLDTERQQRFDLALAKIRSGESRKQAILSSGMDPRTFNKLLNAREETLYLTKTDKKGHYRLSGSSTSYARWDVFNGESQHKHFFDYENSQTMSAYWNAVQADLRSGYKHTLSRFDGKYVYDIHGEKLPLETDYNALERWHSRIINHRQEQDYFNDNIYEKVSNAA